MDSGCHKHAHTQRNERAHTNFTANKVIMGNQSGALLCCGAWLNRQCFMGKSMGRLYSGMESLLQHCKQYKARI